MFLNVYSISDCVIPWASMKVINRHSCPIHLPSHTAGGWASTTFRRAKDCGRKEPGSTRVGEGDCGENDQGLKEALELELAARAHPFLPVAPESHRSLRSRMKINAFEQDPKKLKLNHN